MAAVRESGWISRADLARHTGMARTTVSALVEELLASGLLTEQAAAADGVRSGRPARLVGLGPAAGSVVAATVRAEGLRVVVADLGGEIRAEGQAAPGSDLAELVERCLAEAGPGPVWATVVGSSGTESRTSPGTDPGTDPADPGLRPSAEPARTAPPASRAAARIAGRAPSAVRPSADRPPASTAASTSAVTSVPTSVRASDPAATAAVSTASLPGRTVSRRRIGDLGLVGEVTRGVAVGHTDVCYLWISDTIQCGLMLNGRLQSGRSGPAAGIGHVQVDETGALCRCGRRGCLETIVSPAAILAALERMYLDAAPDRMAHDDPAVERVLTDAGQMLGRVLAGLAATVNPALVVLSGPLVEEDSPFVAGARAALRHHAPRELADGTQIRVSALGERGALLGAVSLALHATPGERSNRILPGSVQSAGLVSERERAVRRRMITDTLRTHGVMARSEIVRHTQLPRAAVAELLADLHHDGVVESATPPAPQTGRPSPHFRLARPTGRLLGLALEAEGVRAVLADRTGTRIASGFLPLPPSPDGATQIGIVARYAGELLNEYGCPPGPGTAVALAVPAPIHPVTGYFGKHSVLPHFSGYSPARQMSDQLGCHVQVFNNAQLAALGEARRGAARGARDVVFIKASQHCGAGILAGGRSYGGALGYAGEISHLTVREVGPLCICGRRGCLSVFLQPDAFTAVLDRYGPPTEDRLLTLAAQGHAPARLALLDAGRLIGRTAAVLCDLLAPAVVVVGGRFTAPGDQVTDGVREALHRHCTPDVAAGLQVVRGELGAEAEVWGAVESLL